jgi:glycosyltransferase involved in cell wall biosynthesis
MAAKLPLSVAIVTFNEEKKLAACLESVAPFAAEIVVVDSYSTDGSVTCAERYGARVTQRAWPGFLAQKNFAFELCTQEWVLGIDHDECVSPELQASIRRAIEANDPTIAGFEINRKNFYLGRWIEHSWYPDWIIRMARRGKGKWAGSEMHARLDVEGEVRRLEGDLHHYPYANLQAHLERTIQYAKMNATYMAEAGVQARWHHVLLRPIGAFLKKMILKGAWLDGIPGVIIAFSSLIGVFAKYAYLWEMQRSNKSKY